jgi:hypothetical protein
MAFFATERTDDQSGRIKLRADSLQTLQLLRNECTGLKTLEALVYDQSSSYLVTEGEENTESVRDVLLKIDAELRGIASLRKIIVRVYNGSPTSSIRDFLEGLGWVVLIGDR